MHSIYSQDKIISGRVISDFFETIPGVSIMINDTVEVGRTDLNGFFQISIPIPVKKLLFESVGLDPVAIEITDKCDIVDVVMMLSGTDDFITLRKADKIRKKRFKKLPNIHRKAFYKNIFKTYSACYKQEFIPYYKKKQK